jgi:hypothetical protein
VTIENLLVAWSRSSQDQTRRGSGRFEDWPDAAALEFAEAGHRSGAGVED